jgi:predicted  nucleic acid-binding Zn-ribbon protein
MMKSKNIVKKIKDSFRLIKAFKKKEKSIVNEEAIDQFKEHLKKHEDAVELRNEIGLLKNTIKSKKKEMNKTLKDLSASRKTTKKVLKKSKKATIPASKKLPVNKTAGTLKPTIAKKKKTPPKKISVAANKSV